MDEKEKSVDLPEESEDLKENEGLEENEGLDEETEDSQEEYEDAQEQEETKEEDDDDNDYVSARSELSSIASKISKKSSLALKTSKNPSIASKTIKSSVTSDIIVRKISEYQYQQPEPERRTSRFFIREPKGPLITLKNLTSTDHLLLTMAPGGVTVLPNLETLPYNTNFYNLLNTSGRILYSAVRTFQYENCQVVRVFDMCVLDPFGGGLINLNGDSNENEVCTITREGSVVEKLGDVNFTPATFNSRKSRSSTITESLTGKKYIITTKKPGNKRGEFIIWYKFKDSAGIDKFKIVAQLSSTLWKDKFKGTPKQPEHPILYGIQFIDKTTEPDTRALLLAAMLLNYFHNFNAGGQVRKSIFSGAQGCCCACWAIFFAINFTIMLIGILYTGIIKEHDYLRDIS